MPISYNLDTTGLNPSNLIVDEQHVLTEVNVHPQRLIIPTYAPFSIVNFSIKHIDSVGNQTILQENVDYFLTLSYIQATRSLGFTVYGGISINSVSLTGNIYLTYQTLGGDTITNPQIVLDKLIELVYNPRTTVWDAVTDKPCVFPPLDHIEDMDYMFGLQSLVQSINTVGDVILAGNDPSNRAYFSHLLDTGNPHLTNKTQLGLSNVENLSLATNDDIASHLEVDKYITLKQVITLLRSYGLIS